MWPSYLWHGNDHTWESRSLYWDWTQVPCACLLHLLGKKWSNGAWYRNWRCNYSVTNHTDKPSLCEQWQRIVAKCCSQMSLPWACFIQRNGKLLKELMAAVTIMPSWKRVLHAHFNIASTPLHSWNLTQTYPIDSAQGPVISEYLRKSRTQYDKTNNLYISTHIWCISALRGIIWDFRNYIQRPLYSYLRPLWYDVTLDVDHSLWL